jgi:ribosomal protein S18 acetylase RimI-like enzyme
MTCGPVDGYALRNIVESDHPRVIAVVPDWWGGRDLAWMLPRLFFIHFGNTSFVLERGDELGAFLVGFLSPARPSEGYIHFVGVHPEHRGRGVGRLLYDRFFDICRAYGRDTVRSCTSPVNRGSVEFHRRLGFDLVSGNAEMDGLPVTLDYNRPGDPKVLFVRRIGVSSGNGPGRP